VSLTPRALADCRELLILVTGAEKGAALAAWRAGADLPVGEVASGRAARVLVDRAADGAGVYR
jgi:6-phosphogluconolactonase